MKFSISREALLRPLALVAGVVERRQTLPVLSNVLIQVQDTQVALTGTDLEVELIGRTAADSGRGAGLGHGASTQADGYLQVAARAVGDPVRSGRRACRAAQRPLALHAVDLAGGGVPQYRGRPGHVELSLPRGTLKHLIDRLPSPWPSRTCAITSTACCSSCAPTWCAPSRPTATVWPSARAPADIEVEPAQKLIVPRKGMLELVRLLDDSEEPVSLTLGSTHVRAHTGEFTFTSKLVDGKFPDYERVVPRVMATRCSSPTVPSCVRCLSRTSILSNEKYRGVRLHLEEGNLRVMANNPEQEEAEENVAIEYNGPAWKSASMSAISLMCWGCSTRIACR